MFTQAEIDFDAALAEAEREQEIYTNIEVALANARDEFTAKWPNHCKECGGWGMHSFTQRHPYGMGTASEELQEPCEGMKECRCHRCGENAMTLLPNLEFTGPCQNCGWNFDDGVPG